MSLMVSASWNGVGNPLSCLALLEEQLMMSILLGSKPQHLILLS
jgi:hypothetical protein